MSYLKKKNNKKFIIPIVIVILVISVFAVIKIRAGGQGYRTISVVEVSGSVSVVRDGIEHSAYVGMHLQEGHEIVTAGNSYVRLVLDGNKYVKLESGSRLIFEKLGFLGSGKTSMKIERGSLTSEIVKPLGEDEEFVVNTPNAVLAVRGTFFRVDLSSTDNGEIVADVTTYGGAVASKRIQPTGKVLVEAGFKTSINMDTEKTVYVVEGVKTEDVKEDTVVSEPVKIEDIPDEDMVDIFFATQNGHELFVTEEEAKADIEVRDILIEEYTPVYEKAEVVLEAKEIKSNKIAKAEIYANDAKPIEMAPEEVKKEETSEGDSLVNNNTSQGVSGIPVIDGLGTEKPKPHNHEYVEEISKEATCVEAGEKTFTCECGDVYTEEIEATGHIEIAGAKEAAHSICEVCNEVLEDGSMHVYADEVIREATCVEDGELRYSCECGYTYTEAIPATGHSELPGATTECHSLCGICGEIMSSEHVYATEVTKEPTCTEKGETTYICECGGTYTEPIPAKGHVSVFGGTVDSHTVCMVCGEVLENGEAHTYTSLVNKAATCTDKGEIIHTCECGSTYTEIIPEKGHANTVGGTKDCHTMCNVCGEVLENGTAHTYTSTVTTEPTCLDTGVRTYTCDCGYSYTEVIPANGHTEAKGNAADCHVMCDVCKEVLQDGSYHSFTDKVAVEPSCTIPGKREYTCSCGYMYAYEITELGHDYVDAKDEPTDTQNGRIYEKCSKCGEEINEELIVALNTVNFPDANILALMEPYNTDGEAGLSVDEIAAITILQTEEDVVITSVKGIEYLTALEQVMIMNASSLNKIDVTNNTALNTIALPGAAITDIDVSNCPNLQMLMLSNATNLGSLDISNNAELNYLYIDNTDVKELDASGKDKMTYLIATGSSLGSINLNGCTSLQSLQVSDTELTSLDISTCTALYEIDAQNLAVSSLDATDCQALRTINIDGSEVTEINLTGLDNLDILKANRTNITELDVIDVADTLTTLEMADSKLEKIMWPTNGTKAALSRINISGTAMTSVLFNGIFDSLQSITCGGDRIESFTFISRDSSSLSSVTVTDSSSLTSFSITDSNYFVSVGSIDLSGCEALESVVINGCTSLTGLSLPTGTSLKTLDLTNCASMDTLGTGNTSALESLGITNTAISTVDINAFPVLKNLYASSTFEGTGLSGDIVISGHSALETIDLSGTQVDSITISNVGTLTSLKISDSEKINLVDVSGCTNLANCELKNNTMLNAVRLVGAPISDVNAMLEGTTTVDELNVSGNTAVVTIDFNNLPNVTVINVSGCTGLLGLEIDSAIILEQLNISETNFAGINLANNMGLQSLEADGSAIISLDVTTCNNITNISVADCTSLTEINASGCTMLTGIQHTGCTELITVDISGCTSFGAVSINTLPAIDTYIANGCTSLTSFKAETGGSTLKTLNLSGCTSLTEVELTSATELVNLNIGQCSALTSIDISMLTNLEVFYANSAGIKNLSGNTTILDFSSNPNLKEIQVNEFTSFSEVNLTANTKLEKFIYLSIPMTTVDFSNCVALQNFQTGSASLTSLDFSNCPNMIRIIAQNSGALKSLNMNGCTKLYDVRLAGSNNINSVDLTNTGSEVELGAYKEGEYLVFAVTSGSTTATTLQNAAGWNDSIMSITN